MRATVITAHGHELVVQYGHPTTEKKIDLQHADLESHFRCSGQPRQSSRDDETSASMLLSTDQGTAAAGVINSGSEAVSWAKDKRSLQCKSTRNLQLLVVYGSILADCLLIDGMGLS